MKKIKKPVTKTRQRVPKAQRERLLLKGRDQGVIFAVAEAIRLGYQDVAREIFTPYFGDPMSQKATRTVLNAKADGFDMKPLKSLGWV